jgi:hypothetical protein
MQILFLCSFEKVRRESILCQWLAASNGDATTRAPIESPVFFDFCHHFIDTHLTANNLQSILITYLGALPAGITLFPFNHRFILFSQANRLDGTCRDAWSTTCLGANASRFNKPKLRQALLRFRIGTPQAPKWAPFQKDQRPDSGTIMDRVPLYIKDPASYFTCNYILTN